MTPHLIHNYKTFNSSLFQLRHVISVEKDPLFFVLIILKKYLYQPSLMLSAGLCGTRWIEWKISGFLSSGLGCWVGVLTTLGLVTVLGDTDIKFLSNLFNFEGLNLIICCCYICLNFPLFLPFEIAG